MNDWLSMLWLVEWWIEIWTLSNVPQEVVD